MSRSVMVTLWFCFVCDRVGGMLAHWDHDNFHCGKKMKRVFGDREELKEKYRRGEIHE